MYPSGVKSQRLRHSLEIGVALDDMFSQTFQEQVMSYFCAFPLYSVFNLALQLPYTSWSQVRKAKEKSLDLHGILA